MNSVIYGTVTHSLELFFYTHVCKQTDNILLEPVWCFTTGPNDQCESKPFGEDCKQVFEPLPLTTELPTAYTGI